MPKFRADNILTSRRSIEGERKLISVLFGDVANYTSMAEKLDPEGVHQIVDGCFRILMDEIHRYERTIVAQFGPSDLKSAHAQDSHANKRHQVPVGILSLAPDDFKRRIAQGFSSFW